MTYQSDDYPAYPGSEVRALKVDFEALELFARKLGIAVTLRSGGSFFDPAQRLINIDTKTRTRRGFVSCGQLTDEYLHAWNQVNGRGKHMPERLAKLHIEWGRAAAAHGTRSLGSNQNASFHRLEALNFVDSGAEVPSFIWRAPLELVRAFAYAWSDNLEL